MRTLVTFHVRGGSDVLIHVDDDTLGEDNTGVFRVVDDFATVEHPDLGTAIRAALAATGWGPYRVELES